MNNLPKIRGTAYHGISHGIAPNVLETIQPAYCKKGIHAFDEVWSPNDHYLSCDCCGLKVNIKSIEEPKKEKSAPSEIKYRTFKVLRYGFDTGGRIMVGTKRIFRSKGMGDGDILIKAAFAFCSPHDNFNRTIGKDIIKENFDLGINIEFIVTKDDNLTIILKKKLIEFAEGWKSYEPIYWMKGVKITDLV